MSTNLAKQKREMVIRQVHAIKEHIACAEQNEQTARMMSYIAEIEKSVTGEQYGLVFERHREEIEDFLESHLPFLSESVELFINRGGQLNTLIEGENLAALQLLLETHQGRIDVIYIDPPYNTRNKGGSYDDAFVDKNDRFLHSKWLSFMEKRLQMAQKLLSKQGLMLISIDDNEYAHLKMLCDRLFSEENVETMIWQKVGDGDAGAGRMKATRRFRIEHEYILVCYQNKNRMAFKKVLEIPCFKNKYTNPDNDVRGAYKAGNISKDERKSNPSGKNYYAVTSPTGKVFKRQWHFDKDEFERLNQDGRIYWGKHQDAVPSLKIFVGEKRAVVPSSVLKQSGSATMGNKLMTELFGKPVFKNSKPVKLLTYLLDRIDDKDVTVLDFFAGSGTTGHAVLKLNAEDGGTRRFILCTSNENHICRDVAYERIRRVIDREGYTASLRYFRIDYRTSNADGVQR